MKPFEEYINLLLPYQAAFAGAAGSAAVGDLFSAGVKLCQEELLSETMERRLGRHVYAVVPVPGNFALISIFLATDQFHEVPPRVMERYEGYLSLVRLINPNEIAYIRKTLKRGERLPDGKLVEKIAITADRFQKRNWHQWATSRIDRAFDPPEPIVYGKEVFTFGEVVLEAHPEAEADRLTDIINQLPGYPNGRGHSICVRAGAERRKCVLPDATFGQKAVFPEPPDLPPAGHRRTRSGFAARFDSTYAAGTKLFP